MIVTDRLILLNFPKTGSTFARTVVKQLHGYQDRPARNPVSKRLQRLALRSGLYGFREIYNVTRPTVTRRRVRDQHGGWATVPDKYRDRPVVMVVRDPMTHAVSICRYGWMQENVTHVGGVPVRELFPSFPDLEFEQYLDLLAQIAAVQLQGVGARMPIGYLSLQFIKMLFADPRAAVARLDEDYIESGAFLRDLPSDLHLLRTENLNEELLVCLRELGYSRDETRFIRELPRINVTSGDQSPTVRPQDFFTERLARRFRRDERALYALLAKLGVEY